MTKAFDSIFHTWSPMEWRPNGPCDLDPVHCSFTGVVKTNYELPYLSELPWLLFTFFLARGDVLFARWQCWTVLIAFVDRRSASRLLNVRPSRPAVGGLLRHCVATTVPRLNYRRAGVINKSRDANGKWTFGLCIGRHVFRSWHRDAVRFVSVLFITSSRGNRTHSKR